MALNYAPVHFVNNLPEGKKEGYYAKAKIAETLTQDQFAEYAAEVSGGTQSAGELKLALETIGKAMARLFADSKAVELDFCKLRPTVSFKKSLGYNSVDAADKVTASLLEAGVNVSVADKIVTKTREVSKIKKAVTATVEEGDAPAEDNTQTPANPTPGGGNELEG